MRVRTWLALLALYLGWGTTYLAISYAIETIPPFIMSGTRFLIAGLILYTWRRAAGDPMPNRTQWKSAGIIGMFLLVGGIGGVSLAEQYLPTGIAALITAAIPMWVVVVEYLSPQKVKPSTTSLLGIFLGLVGIFILVDPFHSTSTQPGTQLIGISILVVAGFSWAIGSVLSHSANLPNSSLQSAGMELLVGGAGSMMIGLFTGEAGRLDLTQVGFSSIAGLAYLIAVGSLVGFVCYAWLLKTAPTALVVTYAYVNPLVAITLGSLIAKEIVTTRMLIAIPMIISAVLLIQSKFIKKVTIPQPQISMPESSGDD